MANRKEKELEMASKFMVTVGLYEGPIEEQVDREMLFDEEIKFLRVKNPNDKKVFLPISLDIKSFTVVLPADMNEVTIQVDDFDYKTDHILVFLGGIYLDYNSAYKIEGNKIINLYANSKYGKWHKGYVFNCVVMQNCVVRDIQVQDKFGWM